MIAGQVDHDNFQKVARAMNAGATTLESYAGYATLRTLALVRMVVEETAGGGPVAHIPPAIWQGIRRIVAATLRTLAEGVPRSAEAVDWAELHARDKIIGQLGEEMGLAALPLAASLYEYHVLTGAQTAAEMLGERAWAQLAADRRRPYIQAGIGEVVTEVARAVARSVRL